MVQYALHAGGRRFESCTAHHFFVVPRESAACEKPPRRAVICYMTSARI